MKWTFYTRFLQTMVVFAVVGILTLLHILSFYTHDALGNVGDRLSEGFNPSLVQRDCAVVFGAAVWPGYYGPVASHALADRTVSAARLYERGAVNCIILSGGDSVYGAHEVDIMTDLLLEQNIPEEIIDLDREGVNTLATIKNLAKNRSYIFVSNDFHLARIGLLGQRAGLSANQYNNNNGFVLHAAHYGSGSGLEGLSARYSRESYFVAREAVAWWYYFFLTLV